MKQYLPHILFVVLVAVIIVFVVAPRTLKNGLEAPPRVEEPKLIAQEILPQGDPSFLSSAKLMTGHGYVAAAGDLDNDGKTDIVIGNYNQQSTVYYNKDGAFMSFSVLGEVRNTVAVAISDLNADGWQDVVLLNNNQFSDVWLNNKDGTFNQIHLPGTERLQVCCSVPTGTTISLLPFDAIAIADFNSDGKLDIFIASDRKNLLFLGDGSGNFNPQEFTDIQHTTTLAAGDLNNDGKMDLVIGTDVSKNYILTNNGDGTFTKTALPGERLHTTSVDIADMNKDGKLDVVVGNNNQNNLIYYNEDSTFRQTLLDEQSAYTYRISVGDLNNDGYADLIVGNYNQESHYYLNKKDGTFDKRKFSEASYVRSLAVADIDGDRDVDIIVARDNQPSEVYFNELK